MSRAMFGTIRKLPSGKFQARYLDPDGRRRSAGTHETRKAASAALARIEADLSRGAWRDDRDAGVTFAEFAEQFLEVKSADLAPGSLENHRRNLRLWLLPTFGDKPLGSITVADVDSWWSRTGRLTGKVNRRNIYMTLSGVMRLAVRYRMVPASPCTIKNASADVAEPRPHLTVAQFMLIVEAMPRTLRAPMLTMFGAHLRIGELAGLNRGDVDLPSGKITIARQAQYLAGGLVLRQTKTGRVRTVAMLEPAVAALREYLGDYPALPNAPLFVTPAGTRLTPRAVRLAWNKARATVGLEWAHVHDVRHTSLTEVAAAGATTRETMHRGGHSTPQAALRYQHATETRDAVIAVAASASLASAMS